MPRRGPYFAPRNNRSLSHLTFSRSLQPDPRMLPSSLLAAPVVGMRPAHPTNEISRGAFQHDFFSRTGDGTTDLSDVWRLDAACLDCSKQTG